MPESVGTFLMFEGAAEQAMTFYASPVGGSEIVTIGLCGACVSWQLNLP